MTIRPSSSLILGSLVLALAAAPAFPVSAQTAAPTMDSTSTNAAPPAPAAPATATAPETTPAPTVAPAAPAPADTTMAPAAPTERPATYTVVSHDSLWTIAHKFDTTVVKLRKANHLKKGALLHPGQVLQIPPAPSDTTTK